MVIAESVESKELPIMDARVFGDISFGNKSNGSSHSLQLDRDSYIFCFEGRRGGGKTTAMTWFVVRSVALYNMKVISNYPIEFNMRRFRPDGQSYLQHVEAEPLDFEKLICFDDEYKNCIIVIDEAPDIISHMASQSWRNRLVAAFTRQIRKNFNTLFLAAQDFHLIDKSMRWQVDVIIQCRDAARHIGDNAGIERGEVIWLDFYDNSGQWTGQSTEDRLRKGENPRLTQLHLFPRILWGDDGHEAVFNSWYQIDILDSLRRVDVRMSSIKIGDKADGGSEYVSISPKTLKMALSTVENVMVDGQIIKQPLFYRQMKVPISEKAMMGQLLASFGMEVDDRDHSKRLCLFNSFDLEGFRQFVREANQLERGG